MIALATSLLALSSIDPIASPLAEIDLVPGHLPLVEVTLPDLPQRTMVLDTGAGNSLIFEAARNSSALTVVGTSQMGAGSDRDQVEADLARIDQVSIDGYPLTNIEMTVFDVPGMPSSSMGVLSPTEFANNVLTIDFGNSRLSVFDADYPVPDSAHSYANSSWELPEYDVKIGDIEFSAVLDSGNPFPVLLPLSWMDRFEIIGEPEIVNQVQLVDGVAYVYRVNLVTPLELGIYRIPGIPVYFIEGQQQANIGSGILSSFVVGMDIPNERVWLEPSSIAQTGHANQTRP
jgi:hypothetical protein